MQQLEVLSGDWIFVALPQEPDLVCILEIFNLDRIALELLVISFDRPRILHAAMDHLFFAIPLDVELDGGHQRRRHDRHDRDDQQEREQDIALLIPPEASPSSRAVNHRDAQMSTGFNFPVTKLPNYSISFYPCVSGMVCGGPLYTMS